MHRPSAANRPYLNRSPEYSTLEVNDANEGTAMEIVDRNPHSNLPEVMPGPSKEETATAWKPAADGGCGREGDGEVGEQQQEEEEQHSSEGGSRGQRGRGLVVCGLRPWVFWLLVGAVVLVVAVAAALGAGFGTLAHNRDQAGTPSPTTTPATTIPSNATTGSRSLAGSRLSAISWTAYSGNAWRGVFFQSGDHLFFSRRDPDTGTWAELNISAQFKPALTAKASTPLASSTKPIQLGLGFDVTLCFLDLGGRVREIITNDEDLAQWRKSDAGFWDVEMVAGVTSDLATIGYYCDDGPCWNQKIVTYQDSSGWILAIDGRNWTAPGAAVTLGQAGAGMAMAPTPWWNGMAPSVGNSSTVRFWYSEEHEVNEALYNDWVPYGWTGGVQAVFSGFSTRGRLLPQLAASSWLAPGFPLVVALDPLGVMTASYMSGPERYDPPNQSQPTTWKNADGSVGTGAPAGGVSAMAMNGAYGMYTLAADEDQVVEWAWSSSSPCNFFNPQVVIRG